VGGDGYVIRFAGLAGIHSGPGAIPEPGQYLVDADPDAHDGRGSATWTTDHHQARLFAHQMEAFNYWRAQSTVRPRRPDGQPNRPLTACSIEVVHLSHAIQEGPDIRTD
jgi:hypothetical protein